MNTGADPDRHVLAVTIHNTRREECQRGWVIFFPGCSGEGSWEAWAMLGRGMGASRGMGDAGGRPLVGAWATPGRGGMGLGGRLCPGVALYSASLGAGPGRESFR